MNNDICTGQYRVAGIADYPAYAHVHYGERGQRDFDEADYRAGGYEPPFDDLEWRARGGAPLRPEAAKRAVQPDAATNAYGPQDTRVRTA